MEPMTVQVLIARPREEVFAYLADVANHAEFCDHYLVDWHLTREDPYGAGAGARFKVKAPLNRFPWADVTFAEVEAPRLIVGRGRSGKYNRVRTLGTWELEPASNDTTKVSFTFETDPKLPSDKLLEVLGRGWLRRKNARAVERLRTILEEDRARGTRVTVAAG